MCSSPILLPNPYYHPDSKDTFTGDKFRIRASNDKYHDTINSKISVPCGKCQQCISLRQSYYNQRVQMESLRSELFYFTLTYNNRSLKFTDVLDYKIPYPYYRDIQDCFRRMRLALLEMGVYIPIRYMCVSEYGKKCFRPHYHGYIAIERDSINKYFLGNWRNCEKFLYSFLLSNWKRNYGTRKFPKYDNLLDLVIKRGRSTYDFHHVEPIRNHDNDITFYVTKYILEYDERTVKLLQKINLDPRLSDVDTKLLRSQIKPRCVMSKDFGDAKFPEIAHYITKCIDKSHLDVPQFYDINTGVSTLLSRYYRKHLYPNECLIDRYNRYQELTNRSNVNTFTPSELDDTVIYDFSCRSKKSALSQKKLRKIRNKLKK